jgi:DNA-binding CsgD family transcriptional regulator
LVAETYPRASLLGRRAECAAIDRLVSDVVAGSSRVLVLHGDAGVGKTAILAYLSQRVAGWRVTRAVGVESERELAYSGLKQWCAPLLDVLDKLPGPQRAALQIVFGMTSGPVPDQFFVGLATLTLMAEAAEHDPLACVIDDAQWLDDASAQILAFVARRLLAERVALVCAARTGAEDGVLAGLPAMPIHGLADGDARVLLLGHVRGPLDPAVTDQIVAESHGNPLALLELPRSRGPADLAGGFGLPGAQPVAGKIEQSYLRRLLPLPPDTRLLVLAAAAEPLGDAMLLHRAAEALGIDMAALTPAVDAGLLEVRGRVRFAHPLVRSATYRAAGAGDRQRAHRALAEATDPATDPDRRAWHLAQSAPWPDEDIAAELESSAGRAQARGGLAAAAAFLRHSVALTPDTARRADRALSAAQASLKAGAFGATLGLVATAEAGALDESQRAQVDLLRGHVAFASGRGEGEAPALLLKAAKGLEPYDRQLARETYLTAWGAAVDAGHRAGRKLLPEICRAVRALPPAPGEPRPLDLLLDGLARLTTDGRSAAILTLQRAATAISSIPVTDVLRWGWLAAAASGTLWDPEGMEAISARNVRLIRDAGALAALPHPLISWGLARAWKGDFTVAAALIAEAEDVATATGSQFAPYTALRLLALRGNQAEASALIASAIGQAAAGGPEMAAAQAHWAAAVLHNGLARFRKAASAARQATSDPYEPWASTFALPELVEAAARNGDAEVAHDALARLVETTRPCGTDFALGIEARSRALLSDGGTADGLYREAIARLSGTQLRPDLARAHLLYGEWLRGEDRRTDAREQLRTAHDMLAEIGMAAFTERARRELAATGEKVRTRKAETREQLTPQEEQIARLARDGLSNPEIGAQLFISARTVEWHLRKVFTKLGISSRRQIRRALADRGGTVATA